MRRCRRRALRRPTIRKTVYIDQVALLRRRAIEQPFRQARRRKGLGRLHRFFRTVSH